MFHGGQFIFFKQKLQQPASSTHIILQKLIFTSSSSADDILPEKVKVISKLCPTNDSFCSSKREIQSE